MNEAQARKIFNKAIGECTNADQVEKLELCREYFTNPEFRKVLEELTFEINQGNSP